jgi:hypothetical protein
LNSVSQKRKWKEVKSEETFGKKSFRLRQQLEQEANKEIMLAKDFEKELKEIDAYK